VAVDSAFFLAHAGRELTTTTPAVEAAAERRNCLLDFVFMGTLLGLPDAGARIRRIAGRKILPDNH
jgi:hypothetical protein